MGSVFDVASRDLQSVQVRGAFGCDHRHLAIALERKLARRAGGVCGGDQVPAVPRQESVALRQRLPMTHHVFNLRE